MIKSAIFALFIVAVSAAPHRNDDDFVCPEEDIAATQCKGPKDCLYPNPDNCNTFIHCEVNADGKTGTPVVKDCAPADPPLEWNDNTKQCDYAANSTCPNKPSPSSTTPEDEPETTAAPTTTEQPTDEPTNAPTTQEPSSSSTEGERSTTKEPTKGPTIPTPTTQKPSSSTSGSTFVCPKEDIAATQCKGPKDCLYPNPESCFNYIQCTVNADGVTGTPVVRPCAPADPPLQWNDNKKQCDYASESTCKGTTPNPPSSSTTGAPQETTTTGAPDDTTTQGSETTTGAEGSSPTTTQRSETTTENACKPADEDEDDKQDWDSWCGSGCKNNRTVAHPKNKEKFVQCLDNGTGVVRLCSPGLLWDDDKLTCDYGGLVDKNGPKSRR